VHFEDVSQVSLRDATVLRSAGGLFSVALSVALRVAQALARAPQLRPLALPGALPVKSSAPHKVKSVPQDGVRTFLPPSHLPMTKPAIPGPPPFHYTSTIVRAMAGKYAEYPTSNRGFGIRDRRRCFRLAFISHGPETEERNIAKR